MDVQQSYSLMCLPGNGMNLKRTVKPLLPIPILFC